MDEPWMPATLATSVLAETTIPDVPEWIAQAGSAANFAYDEFFYGKIRNPFTRKAYLNAVRRFADWCQLLKIDLVHVMPGDLGRYLDSLNVAPPTRKLHLAALRRFFDELVMRHVIILNPALSVRSQRYQVMEGKTPEISIEHARRLLRSIDTSNIVGLRDRTIIEILIYTAARVGAVAKLRRTDFYDVADQYCLRFNEKGGKVREIPARHDLQLSLQEYLDRTGLSIAEPSSPMFCTAVRRTKRLTTSGMTADHPLRKAFPIPAVRGQL